MKHTSLLCLLLLSTITIHSMEKLSDDKIIYNIAPRLDRDDRTALKLTNNYFCKIIVPQHVLNEQYQLTCLTENKEQIEELRKKGALKIEEEAYQLFCHNKPQLIIKIAHKNQNAVRALFLYGIQQNNLQFMQWLLHTKKPHHLSRLLDYAQEEAKSLNRHDITRLLENYTNTQKINFWNEKIKNAKPIKEPFEIISTLPYEPIGTSENSSKNTNDSCIIS